MTISAMKMILYILHIRFSLYQTHRLSLHIIHQTAAARTDALTV